jgi:hypothetical protein
VGVSGGGWGEWGRKAYIYTRFDFEIKMFQKSCEDHAHFEHGEVLAYTHVPTLQKGEENRRFLFFFFICFIFMCSYSINYLIKLKKTIKIYNISLPSSLLFK